MGGSSVARAGPSMSLTFVARPPITIAFTRPASPGIELEPGDAEHVAEIFRTPLTGSYNWDYAEADRRLRKLYRLGKERNWNAELDVNWSPPFSKRESPVVEGFNPFEGF